MGKSHHSGWVVLRGKKWYGYYRRTVLDPITNERKADVVSVILGLRSQLTEGVAREALQKEIAKQTGQNLGGRIMKDGSVTFGWFVRNRYYPLRSSEPTIGESPTRLARETEAAMSPFVFHRGQKSISISAYANEEHRIVAAQKHRLTERPLVGEPR